ncbi:flagellar hook-associated protein FlgK [Nitrospirillum sp. BR 11163]|uniref:flagellar hook-associated protein FlgK n=1 Tax=Nitrospirillum sp. BR 11163 TaxID=3104323 RepID=UPI002AFDDB78|nr:flagellar hook-associated protein FlgK [Nitrospirillum sp. BR 11163]MEA1675095.1 flagellar hook-associated protein FlgK [Nitrospirillum sp. BR 11163]
MSLFSALNSAANSLNVIQAGIQVVSDNMNNANSPDRTKHTVSQTTDPLSGVTISQYSRSVDVALQAQLQGTTSENGMQQVLSQYMSQIGGMLGTTNSSNSSDSATPKLTQAFQDFTKALQDLSASPESAVAQNQVVQKAQALVQTIHTLSAGVDQMEVQAKGDITQTVKSINTDLTQIDQLNATISQLKASNQPTADFEDQRDATLRDLSSMINVRTTQRDDGSIAVFTPTGATLVDGTATQLSYDGKVISGAGGADITAAVSSGKLGGLLDLVADSSPAPASGDATTEVFRKLKSQLDAVAGALTGTTQAGQPTSITDAYNKAGPTNDGELASGLFSGADAGTLSVNKDLLNGTKTIKQSAVNAMVGAMTATGRTMTADGLTLTNVSYGGMADQVSSNWSTIQSNVNTQATTTSSFMTSLQTRYASSTGVNMDEEVANLQVLQRNYSATARVISVIGQMFDTLSQAVT